MEKEESTGSESGSSLDGGALINSLLGYLRNSSLARSLLVFLLLFPNIWGFNKL